MRQRGKKKREEPERVEEEGGGGVTKQKMKKDIKEWELKEVRPITGFSVAFKDAWDRWQLQTISHHRAASSQEEIRDSSIQAPSSPASSHLSFTHTLHLPHAHLPPLPPVLGFSQTGCFDVAQCERAAVGHGAAAVLLGHWAGGPLGADSSAAQSVGLSGARHFQVSLKRSGRVNPL